MRERGFTLFELLIYVALLVILIGPVTLIVLTSIRTNVENDVVNKVSERNRVALSRIGEDVRPSIEASLVLGTSGRSVACDLPDGFDGSVVVPGDTVQFELQSVPDDPTNGADDNGNGLVDEGQLVRRNVDTGEAVTICQGIDLAQSSFSRNGTQVVVTLVNQAVIPHSGATYSINRTTRITPRN